MKCTKVCCYMGNSFEKTWMEMNKGRIETQGIKFKGTTFRYQSMRTYIIIENGNFMEWPTCRHVMLGHAYIFGLWSGVLYDTMNDFLLNRFITTDLRKLMLKTTTYRAYSLLHLGHICNFQNGINVHLLCCMILIDISYSLVLAIMMKNTTHWEQFLSSIQNTEVKMNTLTQIYTCAFVYSPILVQSLQKIYSGIKLAIRVHISLHSNEIIH